MFFLALIYAAMNILSFVALQYIGAGEFTICAQLKILSTAGFSVLVMRTSLSWTKWRALIQLVFGCILVASPNFSGSDAASSSGHSAIHPIGEGETGTGTGASHSFLQLLGYGAVLTEVLLSGFASIYFERVVKSTTEVVTIWERNFQLAVYSMVLYIVYIIYDLHTGARTEVGAGWTYITFCVSSLGALGGLLVAATLKYADSILKTLASAGAIVLSTVLGHLWMDGPFGLIVCIGAMTTILSIMNYSWDTTVGNGNSGASTSSSSSSSSSPVAVSTQKI
jgi:UDP-sugar transporter A1/2/3